MSPTFLPPRMEPVATVHVSLWSDDDPHLEGRILELSVERALAAFPVVRRAPWYPLGRQVRLQLATEAAPRKATTKAWIQGWYVEGADQVYQLRFCDEAQVELEVLPILHEAFNRREVYRAKPAPREAIAARVRGSQRAPGIPAELVDYSSRGASIVLDDEEALGGDGMNVLLALDFEGERSIELGCRIVHRQLLGSRVCYGVEFDAAATENFEEKANLLARHVLETQSEELRRRAG